MGVKTTRALELEEWQLDSPAAMLECLEETAAQGYRGQVRVLHAGDALLWDLEISVENTNVLTAQLGQVVVLFGGTLEAITPEEYTARFGE